MNGYHHILRVSKFNKASQRDQKTPHLSDFSAHTSGIKCLGTSNQQKKIKETLEAP